MQKKIFCDGCDSSIKMPRNGFCPNCGTEIPNPKRVVFAPSFKRDGEEKIRQAEAVWDSALQS